MVPHLIIADCRYKALTQLFAVYEANEWISQQEAQILASNTQQKIKDFFHQQQQTGYHIVSKICLNNALVAVD